MAGTLSIGRVDAEYLIDRAASNVNAIRDRCDEAMRGTLKDALSVTLARWCDRDDPSIWLVRQIDIDVATNTLFPSDELSGSVAYALATTLRDVLVGDGDGVDSIRFADAEALLARFLIDAANGDAWSRWYYRRFRGLRMLSTPAVLRTAMCDDPKRGLNALQRLSESELASVVDALSASDCVWVRAQLEPATDAADAAQCIDACLAVWEAARNARVHEAGRALLVLARASALGAGGHRINNIIDALFKLQELVNDAFRRALVNEREDTADSLQRLRRNPEISAALGRLPDAFHERLLATLSGRDATAPSIAEEGSYFTPFGGAFLLLPQIGEMVSDAALKTGGAETDVGWNDESRALLRLLILSSCMGVQRRENAFADPVLRYACGLLPDCSIRTADAALERLVQTGEAAHKAFAAALAERALPAGLPPRLAAYERAYFRSAKGAGTSSSWTRLVNQSAYQVLRAFAHRLPGFTDSRCAYLWKNFLDIGARVDTEPDRVVVYLSRAPLHLVLSLTGMTRASYVLPFGDSRRFSLFAAD